MTHNCWVPTMDSESLPTSYMRTNDWNNRNLSNFLVTDTHTPVSVTASAITSSIFICTCSSPTLFGNENEIQLYSLLLVQNFAKWPSWFYRKQCWIILLLSSLSSGFLSLVRYTGNFSNILVNCSTLCSSSGGCTLLTPMGFCITWAMFTI